jgi:hypothetical protein
VRWWQDIATAPHAPPVELDEHKEIPTQGVGVAAETADFPKAPLISGPNTAERSDRDHLMKNFLRFATPSPPPEVTQ